MTIPLGSQLPTIEDDRDVRIRGTTDRRVTITRSTAVDISVKFRFLDVEADGSLTVDGLRFTGADNRVAIGGFGGAIQNQVGGTLDVANCEFIGNLAESGGAIGNAGTMTISGGAAGQTTLFVSNRSQGQGGAIATGAVGVCSATISSTEFVGNIAGDDPAGLGTQKGGAIAFRTGGTLTLDDCEFQGNKAQDGGALYASVPAAAGPTLIASDCLFDGNVAESGGDGGAAFISTANARFNRCEFKNNNAAGEGGAILQDRGALTLDNNIFGPNLAGGPNLSHQVANRLNPIPAPITLIGTNSGYYVVNV